MSLLAALMLFVLASDQLIDGSSFFSMLTRIDGIVLLAFCNLHLLHSRYLQSRCR